MQTVKPGKALDLGCGQGRNSLFLAQNGFDVTAVDQNELSLEILQSIVEQGRPRYACWSLRHQFSQYWERL